MNYTNFQLILQKIINRYISVRISDGMKKNLHFRAWFYFRQGWATYFAFIFSAINTMVVTYYLAIEKISILKEVFSSFWIYSAVVTSIGIPILVAVGYVHFKRSSAFASESDIATESNPYFYKLPPGFWRDVFAPVYLMMTNLLVKSLKNEKLTDDEIQKIAELQKKLDILIKGEMIGRSRIKSPSSDSEDK